jgi:hypothetical protein
MNRNEETPAANAESVIVRWGAVSLPALRSSLRRRKIRMPVTEAVKAGRGGASVGGGGGVSRGAEAAYLGTSCAYRHLH